MPKFKIGDVVIISKKIVDWDDWTWLDEMDKYLGKLGTVRDIEKPLYDNYTYGVSTDDGMEFFYSEESLQANYVDFLA